MPGLRRLSCMLARADGGARRRRPGRARQERQRARCLRAALAALALLAPGVAPAPARAEEPAETIAARARQVLADERFQTEHPPPGAPGASAPFDGLPGAGNGAGPERGARPPGEGEGEGEGEPRDPPGRGAAPPTAMLDVHRAVVADALLLDRGMVLKRLGRRGVFCIDAPPDQAGPELLRRYLEIKRREMIKRPGRAPCVTRRPSAAPRWRLSASRAPVRRRRRHLAPRYDATLYRPPKMNAQRRLGLAAPRPSFMLLPSQPSSSRRSLGSALSGGNPQ